MRVMGRFRASRHPWSELEPFSAHADFRLSKRSQFAGDASNSASAMSFRARWPAPPDGAGDALKRNSEPSRTWRE